MSGTVAYQPSSEFPHDLPGQLALLPDDIRQSDGRFRLKGMNTGRLTRHNSALLVGAVASLEWNRGLGDILSVDEVLAHGGPRWGEKVLRQIDGDLNPDLLAQVRVNNEDVVQAVTLCTQREKEGLAVNDGIEQIRRAYRECGIAWGIMTEDHLNVHRVSTALWLCAAVERAAPAIALHAVRRCLDEASRDMSLADILNRAALVAGVTPAVAADAYGGLIASRQVQFDIEGGVILTGNRPGTHGERPADVRAAWLREFHSVSMTRPAAAAPLGIARLSPYPETRMRRRDRVQTRGLDRRRWTRLEWPN